MFSFSQQESIPNFTPPSPEAAAITQYGNVEINESTGKAAVNIPLYTYVAGKIQVPISINYVGSGVKVNDPNIWTDINWNLNVGGAIIRNVYHYPDEVVQQRIFEDDILALGLIDGIPANNTSPENNAVLLHQFFNNTSSMDTQPDIFNFSFSGY